MSAPYNFDTSNPSNTSAISSYPANEQTFRSTVAAASGVVVDATTGLGPIIATYTTTQKNALVNPPTGLLVHDSTLAKLQINNGTPGSPTWVGVAVS